MSWRRTLYSALGLLVAPLLPLRLWWRGRREPGYRAHVRERFGAYAPGPQVDVWIHAVSVGETRAAAPLIDALREQFPRATLLLTHMTATGRTTGRALFGERVQQAYLPYDLPFAAAAFFRRFRPRLGVLLETELWPNIVASAARERVPLYLVNARLSARSAARYARLRRLTHETLHLLAGIGAQTAADAERLRELGANPIAVTGSLKFDIEVPAAALTLGDQLRERFGVARPVWLAASTRDGEEELLFDALAALPAESLLVVAPRHPQRFEVVAELLRRRGIVFQRRSDEAPIAATTRVVLGDSMGEMFAYYAAADLAFIGGSLLPFGAQNLLEACAVGTPVLAGPHTFNFAEATELALAAGAALRINDARDLMRNVEQLLTDAGTRSRMSAAGRAFYQAHRGATQRTLALLAPALASLSRNDAQLNH
jgi:3-deoxy-D-manno-octulosonic-acid transferase